MTLPSVVRDLLIIFASSRVYPVAPVLEIFSDPARSTRYNFPVLQDISSRLFWVTVRMKME